MFKKGGKEIHVLPGSRFPHNPVDLKVLDFISVSFEESSHQRCKFKISVDGQAILIYQANLYIAVVYILLCISIIMVTITRHIFINIFRREHFSAVKLAKSYEKNMSYLTISKSQNV